MTYPPQSGQPPYGQQPNGPYGTPSPGGFPQQGNQYPHPQALYGQQGGFNPQEPRKSKTGLIVGVSTAAVVLVAFLITGLVAPGFLLDADESTNDEKAAAAESSTNTPTNPAGSGAVTSSDQTTPTSATDPVSVATNFLETVNAGDAAAAMELVCEQARSKTQPQVDIAVAGSARYSPVGELLEKQLQGGKAYAVEPTGTLNGAPVVGFLTLLKFDSSDNICVAAFAPDMANIQGVGPDESSEEFLQQVNDALNAGDASALDGMMCRQPDEGAAQAVREAASFGGSFTMENADISEYFAHAEFTNSEDTIWVYVDYQREDEGPEGFCILRAQIK
jgi:hypothetical protein